MRVDAKWAFILLGIWLVLEGITSLLGGSALGVVMGFLALAAGVLLLLANVNIKTRTRSRR